MNSNEGIGYNEVIKIYFKVEDKDIFKKLLKKKQYHGVLVEKYIFDKTCVQIKKIDKMPYLTAFKDHLNENIIFKDKEIYRFICVDLKIGDVFKILGLNNKKYGVLQKSQITLYTNIIESDVAVVPISGYSKTRTIMYKYLGEIKSFIDVPTQKINLVCSENHLIFDLKGHKNSIKNVFLSDDKKIASYYYGAIFFYSKEKIGIQNAYNIFIDDFNQNSNLSQHYITKDTIIHFFN